jgi:hypothetical protein
VVLVTYLALVRQIETQIAEFRTAYGKAVAALDKAATAKASRDFRNWVARRASAELIEPPKNSDVLCPMGKEKSFGGHRYFTSNLFWLFKIVLIAADAAQSRSKACSL